MISILATLAAMVSRSKLFVMLVNYSFISHANLLCFVPILVYVQPKQVKFKIICFCTKRHLTKKIASNTNFIIGKI